MMINPFALCDAGAWTFPRVPVGPGTVLSPSLIPSEQPGFPPRWRVMEPGVLKPETAARSQQAAVTPAKRCVVLGHLQEMCGEGSLWLRLPPRQAGLAFVPLRWL